MSAAKVMPATDAVEILRLLEDAEVGVWLTGGWGVDALIGRQTREHGDVDLFIELRHLVEVRELLSEAGFVEAPGGRAANFVLKHGSREVDIHVFEVDSRGDGLYPMADGTTWVCPSEGLAGHGAILGYEMRCFTAELQLQCYSGYELDDDDVHDIAVLQEAFPGAVALPLEVRG